ncbi:hypothetical protein Q0Z83_045510 [Actinoplanes sichuanensis]|uniref:Uncharacterized protein n=1 Tax=Actinoplanes sichuanensis TaxID=512349 RepID=A0ABW4A961_9ACTN|nr:hypothetical protein [Actinoplanes sichuanensis]BEL06360.1 hypothetical protein Q0Z83_045510 [Actinoplanes sichuanensis]
MSGEKVVATQVAATVIPAAAPSIGVGAALAPVLTVAGVVVGAVVVAAGAVVLTRAAMSGLVWLGDSLEDSYQTWAAQQEKLDEWEAVYAKVVACNARLKRVRGRLADSGGGDLPGPISPAGLPRFKVDQMCADVERHIRRAEATMLQRATDEAIRRIPAGQRNPATGRLAERLRTRMADHARRGAVASPVPSPPVPSRPVRGTGGGDFVPMVEAILGGLDPEATAAECTEALTIAGRVTGTDDMTAAKVQMDALYLRVGEINRAAVTRRADADRAARYLEGLRPDLGSHGLISPARLAHQAELRQSLEDVVAGRRRMDGTLAGRAEDARAEAQVMADQLLIRETWRAALADLGYVTTVEEPKAGSGFAAMTVRHASWDGAGARVVVAKDETRAVFLEPGNDQQLLQWARDVMEINRKAFAERGVVLGEIRHTPIEETTTGKSTEERRLQPPKERKRSR